jgi:4-diphosphocytidyl-2-C-methyl-D-erythritol kinase
MTTGADAPPAEMLLAPAKLTRSLRIAGVRQDGFHLLEAEMVTVSLFDRLEISCGEGLHVADDVEWTPALPTGVSGRARADGPDASVPPPPPGPNLVLRALAAAGRRAHVSLRKSIPAGAGLGGGSADAAAVLRWAGISDLGRACELGADVPFCLIGGRALVSGIGESVETLPFESRHLVLVVPRIHVSTPAVYAAWDDLGGPAGDHGNDLEPAALAVEPRLRVWRDLVTEVAGVLPRLAGSGGTWWFDADGGRDEARCLEKELRQAVVAAGESGLVKSVETVPS